MHIHPKHFVSPLNVTLYKLEISEASNKLVLPGPPGIIPCGGGPIMGIIGGPPIGGVGSMPGRGGPPVLQTSCQCKVNVKTMYYAFELEQIHMHHSEISFV